MRRVAVAALLLLAVPAAGVIIDSGDGTGNTTAPSPDPGWDYVGTTYASFTGVYLGDGWVLTAYHVGPTAFTLGGVTYEPIPGASFRMQNPNNSNADLLVYAIADPPVLPLLPIAVDPPAVLSEVCLIGNGHDRGPSTVWNPPGPGSFPGYEWGPAPRTLRWGNNIIQEYPTSMVAGNWTFATYFDQTGGTAHEAQATNGDSGGAAFAWSGSQWELVGSMLAVGSYSGQPDQTSLYGQITYVTDLSVYRDEILDVVSLPEPAGALPAGLVLLAGLGRLRTGRCSGSRRGRDRPAIWQGARPAPISGALPKGSSRQFKEILHEMARLPVTAGNLCSAAARRIAR